jgi:hypothetical protein
LRYTGWEIHACWANVLLRGCEAINDADSRAADVAHAVLGPEYGKRAQTPIKEPAMTTIHLHQTTTATPGQFLAGLTDFGPGRSEIFPNSADGYLKVHEQGPAGADVTEGSIGIWERLRYDWSDPRRITMTTTGSNLWGRHSSHTYTLTQRPDGTMDVDAVVVREGKNLKGRLFEILLAAGGKRVLGKALATTVKAIEARNYQPGPDQS